MDEGDAGRDGGRRREKRRLAAMVSVRFSPEELVALQAQAGRRGVSVSAYLRSLALADMGGGAGWAPEIRGGGGVRSSSTSPFVTPSG